jgi:outer membrane protein
MPRVLTRISFIVLTSFAAVAASAAEQDPSIDPGSGPEGDDPASSYSWGLGVAGISQQQSYAGIDRDNLGIPLIYFENRWVELMGPWLDLKLPGLEWGEAQELKFALRTQLFGFDGYKAKDAPVLSGMNERKSGIYVGPSFKWSSPHVDVFGEAMFDASGNSKGQRYSVGLARQFPFGEHFMLTPSVTATWADKKYGDYYFGVRSTEARTGRPAYAIDDGTLNTQFSLRGDYFIDQRQAVFLEAGYTALDSMIKDSPLTDRSGESMLLFGYLYRFR